MLNKIVINSFLTVLLVGKFLFAGAPVIVHDSLAGVVYSITLYSMKDMAKHYAESNGIGIMPDEDPNKLLFIGDGYYVSQIFNFLAANKVPARKFLAVDDAGLSRVLSYDKKRIEEEIFRSMDYLEKLQEKFGTRSPYTVQAVDRGEWGDVPVIYARGLDGISREWGATSRGKNRKNLFDMFALEVDRYLVSHGFAEKISHENDYENTYEPQFQISIFGTIEIPVLDFRQVGFFQYTFCKEGFCYHRAFKPLTPCCVKSLSNAYSQVYIKNVLTDYLHFVLNNESNNDAIANDLLSKFNQDEIKSFKTILIENNDPNQIN